MSRRKALLLLCSVIVIASLVLLSASLSQVVFEGARPFSVSFKKLPSEQSTSTSFEYGINLLWQRAVVIIMAVLFVLSIISVIIYPRSLRRILRDAVTTAVLVWALYYILTRFRPLTLDESTKGGTPPQSVAGAPTTSLDFNSVNTPNWLVFLFVLGGIVILVLILWGVTRFWRSADIERTELEEIALLVNEAAEQIKAGTGVKNAVLRCYRDMCELLSRRRGVPLEKAMTAREFERQLAAIGVQDEHIGRLSRLFEWVRYGGRDVAASQEREAIECLQVIAKNYGGI